MTTLTLPSGPPKRRIIEMAYGKCGLSGYEFGRTPEEVNDALSELNAMMLEWPFCCLGYEQPTYGNGAPEELSGIPPETLAAVATQLAIRIAPNMGKTLSPEAQRSVSRSMALLYARCASVPSQTLQSNTPRGAGAEKLLRIPFIREDYANQERCVVPIPPDRGITGTPATPTPTPTSPVLSALALSANSILENSAPGTFVGAITNATTGSILSLSDDAGGRFAISGNNLVAGLVSTDYESATSHSITIVETLAGATGSPRSNTFTINVGNVFEQPNLGALTFSATTFLTTASSSGTIIGATPGSTIVATGLPAGLTINGPARTWAWDGTGSAATSSFTLTETLADSSNSPRVSTINYTISAAPGTLQVLTLSASSIAENSAAGTVVGAIQNVTAGSTLSLSDTAGSRFAISGGNIVAGATPTNFEAATTHNITIVETLTGATGSPKSTIIAISVTNVFEQPNLAALSLSASTFVTGSTTSGSIIGATSGSTITASGLPTGLTINGAARTWAWDGTGSVGSGTFNLTETLADSANSPRVTSIGYTISSTLSTPVLSNGAATNPPSWDAVMADLADGDTIELDFTTNGSAPDGTAEDSHVASSTDESIGWPSLGLLAAGTTVKVALRYGRGGVWSAWSNVLTIGPIATWTPAAYFLSNTVGGIPPQGMFFPVSAANCFTDTAGTVAVTAIGQSVAYIKDQSGNGIDMVQNTSGNRPTYQTTTGVFGTGLPYLQFDGTNDMLASGSPSGSYAQPVFSGHSVKAGTTGTIQIEDGRTSGSRLGFFMNSPNWGITAGSGVVSTLAGTTNDAIVTALFNGATSYIRLNGTQSANLSAGTQVDSGITIGSSYVPNTWWNGRWYGGFRLYTNPSSTLRSLLETWLTGLHP